MNVGFVRTHYVDNVVDSRTLQSESTGKRGDLTSGTPVCGNKLSRRKDCGSSSGPYIILEVLYALLLTYRAGRK